MIADLWTLLTRPWPAFRRQAADLVEPPSGVWGAFLRMVAWRLPLDWLVTPLEVWGLQTLWGQVGLAVAKLEVDLALPVLPSFQRLLLWGLVLKVVLLPGLWLHHACWDHGGLWLLKGLRRPQAFRRTLVAEAEALRATALLIPLGALGSLPGLAGMLLAPIAFLANAYGWLLRGVALAAHHEAPLWKGLVATLLHILLFCAFYGIMGMAMWVLMWGLMPPEIT